MSTVFVLLFARLLPKRFLFLGGLFLIAWGFRELLFLCFTWQPQVITTDNLIKRNSRVNSEKLETLGTTSVIGDRCLVKNYSPYSALLVTTNTSLRGHLLKEVRTSIETYGGRGLIVFNVFLRTHIFSLAFKFSFFLSYFLSDL